MKSRIGFVNGNREIFIDDTPYIPAAFRSFRPTPSNVMLFNRCGVKLYQMQLSGRNSTLGLPYSNYGAAWVGDHKYDFAALDNQMEMFMKFAPDGYFMLMVQLDAPKWWLDAHPGAFDSYERIGEAVFSKKWIADATDYLRAFLRYAEEKYQDRVFAYSFSAGCATEWFDERDYYLPSPEKLCAYRAWAGDETAGAPTREEVMDKGKELLREKNSDYARYYRFCATLTPGLISGFARAAQEELRHNKIVGLFFGYTDCPDGGFQNRSATNGYESVWKNPDIDMLFSPAAYGESRNLDGTSSYQYLVDSVALNNKLYLHEIDHRTYLAHYPMDNFGMMGGCYDTEYETIMVLRRELCAAAVKDGALWWFDFMGNYYASPALEKEIALEMKALEKLYEKPHASVSEIAVFADPMSFYLMREETGVNKALVRNNRDSLNQCGAPYDYYNLNDIGRVDASRYKLCIFLNALEISDEARAAIDAKLAGKTKAWVYAADTARGERMSLENIARRVGVPLAFTNDAVERKITFEGETFGFGRAASPMFAVRTEDGVEALARYENGECAAAICGENAYIAAGNVPAALWRALARRAGAHIYAENGGALYADSRFVARQTVRETECEIHMPFDCEMEELFSGEKFSTRNRVFSYTAAKGETKLFLIEKRA